MRIRTAVTLVLAVQVAVAQADWRDMIQQLQGGGAPSAAPRTPSIGLSDAQVVTGLKEALAQGAQSAVSTLGRPGGFLDDPAVRIPLPGTLATVAGALRSMGQGAIVDQLETSMNRAAEAAVPEAGAILHDAIVNMTVEDAFGILRGPNDAATQYFKRVSEDRLRGRMLPIVQEQTSRFGVAAGYKKLLGSAGPVSGLLGQEAMDPDRYVTDQALAGLYKMIAAEEQRIRANPAARTTSVLQQVFGAGLGR